MEHDGAHAEAARQEPQAPIVHQLVHVNFIKFVEVDARGKEINSDRPSAIGYIVYNRDCQEFGQWSFQGSDDYTLEADVYRRIEEHHPRLAKSVRDTEGFYLSGHWCTVSGDRPAVQ